MSYHLDDVRVHSFPDGTTVDTALGAGGLSITLIENAIRSFVCNVPLAAGFGYQQHLANHLEVHLRNVLAIDPVKNLSTRVSPILNEKADLAFGADADSPAVYVEIEFRPNVEKDLVKFQIARNRGRLAVAILILAASRSRINAGYTTMPEFEKVVRIIAELAPPYPLLLIGIAGEHR